MSLFFIDSSTELTKEQVKKIGIEYINIPFIFDGSQTEMLDDFDFNKFYSKLKKGIEIDKIELTSQNYIDIFEPSLVRDDDLIYVYNGTVIENLSDLTNAKQTLLEKYPQRRIELFDTSSFSIGHGIISYCMAIKYRNGATIDELVEFGNKLKREYSTYFILDNANKLSEYGLIDAKNVVSSALSIKPIVSVANDGNYTIVDKVSGKKKAIAELIKYIRQTGENVADYPIGIVYSNNLSEAEDLKVKIVEYFGQDIQVFMQQITPNNITIMGAGVLGLSFHSHKRI